MKKLKSALSWAGAILCVASLGHAGQAMAASRLVTRSNSTCVSCAATSVADSTPQGNAAFQRNIAAILSPAFFQFPDLRELNPVDSLPNAFNPSNYRYTDFDPSFHF